MFPVKKNDEELWSAVRTDCEQAFKQLFDRYWVRLYKTAFRYFQDHETCEEMVQDIFISLWNRRKELDIQIVQNFLIKSVRYQIYNRIKMLKSTVNLSENIILNSRHYSSNEGADRLTNESLLIDLEEHLRELPKRCREIFMMRKMQSLTNQEIALKLGISKRSVENQLTIALKHLRIYLKYTPCSVEKR